jgi:hypothetical protein
MATHNRFFATLDEVLTVIDSALIIGENPIFFTHAALFKATLNKSLRMSAPGFGMGRKAQSAAIPGSIASICLRRRPPKARMRSPHGTCSALP